VLALVLAPLLGACATPPSDPQARADFDARNDPAEPTNRDVFAVDQFVDKNAIKPVAQAYRDDVPVVVQNRLRDFLLNLHAPVIEINDILQGNVSRGWITLQRFIVNTAFGGLGLFDVAASDYNLPYHDADYGETLAVWGIGDGPYVMLPIFGPSNVRDAVGTGLGFVLDPLAWVGGTNAMYANYSRAGANGVDGRAGTIDATDALENSSIDFYAAARSAYRQHRAAEIADAIGKSQGGAVILDEPGLTGP
jgi:phospholipid-binding lipoprotein MlaA